MNAKARCQQAWNYTMKCGMALPAARRNNRKALADAVRVMRENRFDYAVIVEGKFQRLVKV